MDGVTPSHIVGHLRVNTKAAGTAISGAQADAKRRAADYIRIKQRIEALHDRQEDIRDVTERLNEARGDELN